MYNNPVFFYEPRLNPDGTRAVLFADGGIRWFNPTAWRKLKKQSHIP